MLSLKRQLASLSILSPISEVVDAMRTISPRERKLIAMLILCVVAAAVWLLLIGPVISAFGERTARRTQLTQQYQANQRIIGSVPRLRRQAERQREQLRSFAISAPSQTVAAAALLDRVQRAIEEAGGEVRSVEEASDDSAQVRAQASARMTLAQMTDVITRLENEPPYLVFEALDVSADQAVISGRLDIMEVSFEVSVPVILSTSR
jgi:type II secretory pathway component PulM